jgi:VCBS repeat-containing protein
MTNRLEDEIWRIVESMEHEAHTSQEQDLPGATEQKLAPETNTQTPPDEPQDVYVLIVREREEEEDHAQVVDSTLVISQKPSLLPAYAFCCCSVLLIVSMLAFQLYCIFNPPTATVTIIPKSQHVTLSGTLQIGRLLPPITISQSQTTPTTGKGHQDARSATGYITFYNGQLQSVTIPAGTILTASHGVQVITEQDALIPQALPPTEGQVTITTHSINPGVRGNIAASEINQSCCAIAVLAKNTQPFAGGQDERDFQTVAKSDIATIAIPLKTAVAQSVAGAFQGQLNPQERLFLLPCRPTVTSDHQPGQEATAVKVTVSETCSAVAYSSQELAKEATDLLIHRSATQLGTGYGLFGNVQTSVTMATVSNTAKPQVFLAFYAQGTWVYGLSKPAQEQIKRLIAGQTTQDALQLVTALPGVEQAAIRFTGFGDDTRLPKQSRLIHLAFVVV